MNRAMSELEPGLDLHEWETRWAEIEESLGEDPTEALPAACDEVEELLRIRAGDELLEQQAPELAAAYESARDVANRIERGDEVGPGDVGGAVESLRLVRTSLLAPGDA
jgi:hypothetical protein